MVSVLPIIMCDSICRDKQIKKPQPNLNDSIVVLKILRNFYFTKVISSTMCLAAEKFSIITKSKNSIKLNLNKKKTVILKY
jgi:hypothetical protein